MTCLMMTQGIDSRGYILCLLMLLVLVLLIVVRSHVNAEEGEQEIDNTIH